MKTRSPTSSFRLPAPPPRRTLRPVIIWFTGLSASGKTTTANGFAVALRARGHRVEVLDGDEVRRLHGDTGFDRESRRRQVERLGDLAVELSAAGAIVLVAAISPEDAVRKAVRARAPRGFALVYVATPLEVCEARDPKGLYARARRGELRDVAGLDLRYELPEDADLHLDAGAIPPAETIEQVWDWWHGRSAGHSTQI